MKRYLVAVYDIAFVFLVAWNTLNGGSMESQGFTVAVFSGEVRSRLPMTAKCINSINNQSHKNLQKILVNAGSPPHQTQELKDLGVDLEGWVILDFPIDCMEIKEKNWSIHKWNGAAALHIAEKDFFFALNDDDFLANNFFERISNLLYKYPQAQTAMGLRVTYHHATGTYGEKLVPKTKSGLIRPECEPGMNVVREIFFKENLSYGPSLGFQPVCKTDLIREIGPGFFYKGFYPDCGPYFQIVSRFDMAFDSQAYMYWGIHESQDHRKWDLNNYWNCAQDQIYTEFMQFNRDVFKTYLPKNLKDIKNIRKYFQKRIVAVSIFALSSRFSFNHRLIYDPKDLNSITSKRFPFFRHLLVIVRRPRIFLICIAKLLQQKIKSL